MLTGFSPRNMRPSRVTLTTGRFSAFSCTCFTWGTFISRPNSITCAVSIKMMRRTRTTSTRGTTLISDKAAFPRPKRPRPKPPFPPLLKEKAMLYLLLVVALGDVEKLQREILHALADFFQDVPEVIVEHRRGDGRGQAQGGGDQRARNARRHRAHAGGASETQRLERIDDAPHRTEQTD